MTYVPLGIARFRIEATAEGEVLVIPVPKNALILLIFGSLILLCISLAVRGLVLFTIVQSPAILIAVALIFAAIAFLAVWFAWFLLGKETVRLRNGDLELGYSLFGLARRRLYRGADVRNLVPIPLPANIGLVGNPYFASLRFTYGSRSVSFAFGMDDAEAVEIIAWLRKQLPHA